MPAGSNPAESFDVVVIGGGFYGACLAIRLREKHRQVLLLEAAPDLLTQASSINQARVHHGYHYPRSLLTALRSSRNFAPFVSDFAACIVSDFQNLYAVARHVSKTSAGQFQRLCKTIEAPLQPAPAKLARLFDANLIEAAFLAPEVAVNGTALRATMKHRLDEAGVVVRCSCRATRVSKRNGVLAVDLEDQVAITAGRVCSCVYAATNELLQASDLPPLPLKHELAELALVEVPPELSNIGITIVDGPFWSVMPYPSRQLHTLSHVRYTPHRTWYGTDSAPAEVTVTNYPFMVRDAQRYVPPMAQARYVESMYVVKTLLNTNETDDGRPILFREDYGLPGLSVVLGAKIDNIYDMLQVAAP